MIAAGRHLAESCLIGQFVLPVYCLKAFRYKLSGAFYLKARLLVLANKYDDDDDEQIITAWPLHVISPLGFIMCPGIFRYGQLCPGIIKIHYSSSEATFSLLSDDSDNDDNNNNNKSLANVQQQHPSQSSV